MCFYILNLTILLKTATRQPQVFTESVHWVKAILLQWPMGNKITSVIQKRSNVKIGTYTFCISYIPGKEMSLIFEEGGHPSAIYLSLSVCPSRNVQWCWTLIKSWHLTFRTETCTLSSCPNLVIVLLGFSGCRFKSRRCWVPTSDC